MEYIKQFKTCVRRAEKEGWGRTSPHSYTAHDNYVRWLRKNSRLFLCQHAFHEDILEEPLDVEALVDNAYNKEVWGGHRIGLACQVHFAVCVPCCVFLLPLDCLSFYLLPNIFVCVHMQRNQFQSYADEGTRILDSAPEGPNGESALRKFLKVSTNELNMILYHNLWVLAVTYLDSTIMLYRRLLGKCAGLPYC